MIINCALKDEMSPNKRPKVTILLIDPLSKTSSVIPKSRGNNAKANIEEYTVPPINSSMSIGEYA